MCFYANKICNQQPFHISFAKFLERQNMKQNVHNYWEKNISLKTYCSSALQFSQRDISICTSVVLYILFLVRVLRCPLWRGFKMRSGLEHWKENLGLSSKSSRMKMVCSDGKPLYPCVTLHDLMVQKIKS